VPITSEPRLLTWTIPTPQGLWYRAIVVIDKGIFITPKIDVTTLESFKTAAASDTSELVEALTGHGRFARPQYLNWSSITAIRSNASAGLIEIEAGDNATSVAVPDRDRLEKLGRVLAASLKASRTPQG
jgi:hypothetical protein